MRKKTKSKQNLGGIWPPVVFVIALLFGSYLLGSTLNLKSTTNKSEIFNIEPPASYQQKGTVQMRTVGIISPTPTPQGDACNHDMSKKSDPDKCQCTAWLVKCENNKCVDVNLEKSGIPGTKGEICANFDKYNWCATFSKEGDGWYCIGKPVIYLYPERPTLVEVAVITEGKVVVSDPQIESFGGWKNVLAHPDGTLFYKNATYRELFYETDTTKVTRPNAGIIIEKENLRSKLLAFVTQLGLTRQDEQEEFLDWWIPRLNSISTDKLFVSVLERDEKERLDQVVITPKPDTFIDFIVYFAPLEDHQTVTPLVIPPTPQRKGFTAIEWGGVIAK